MRIVFNYYDQYSKFWPGPEGFSVETSRFTGMQRQAPSVVRWRGDTWKLETVQISVDAEYVAVHYVRVMFTDTHSEGT